MQAMSAHAVGQGSSSQKLKEAPMGHYVNTVRPAVGGRLDRGTTPGRGKGYKVATHFLHLLDYIDSDDVFGGIGRIDPIGAQISVGGGLA